MLNEYLLFLAKTATVLVAVIVLLAALARQRQGSGGSDPGRLQARGLNERYRQRAQTLDRAGLDRGPVSPPRGDGEAPRRGHRAAAGLAFRGGGCGCSRILSARPGRDATLTRRACRACAPP
ncbi:MAG: hypothetical protein ACLFSI_04305 [Halorhodospira sp.]